MKPIIFKVYVQPGAKKSEVAGMHDGVIKIRINCPPVEGKANEALITFLSKILGVRQSAIQIDRGDKSRVKTIAILCDSDSDCAALQNKINQLSQPSD